jgi:RNA polymerase sigma-70 factor (ECF subfamily)
MADETDFELLAHWRGGDAAAGNRLLRRHFQTVHRFFRNKVDGDIDDLIQRTFLGLVEALPRIVPVEDEEISAELTKAFAKRGIKVMAGARFTGVVDAPSGVIALREEQQLLLVALRRLPLALQITVELFYWERMGIDDIGIVLEIPPGTVKSRLARARDNLKQTLEQLASSPAARASSIQDLEAWARSLRDVLAALDGVEGPA